MKLPQTGGCQCGAIRYEITEEPQLVYTCHCTDCQRLTSSAFSLGIVVPDGRSGSAGWSRARCSASPIAGGRTSGWFAHTAAPGSAECRGMGCIGCGRALWTIRPGYGRRATFGPAANRPGSRFPRAMRCSRRSLPRDGPGGERRPYFNRFFGWHLAKFPPNDWLGGADPFATGDKQRRGFTSLSQDRQRACNKTATRSAVRHEFWRAFLTFDLATRT